MTPRERRDLDDYLAPDPPDEDEESESEPESASKLDSLWAVLDPRAG